jgi:guanine nucleotide-binding protein G(i) subunit alpha
MLTGSRVDGACIQALTHASGLIQWLRGLVYLKLMRREPQAVPTGEEYDFAAAVMRSDAIDRALQEDATNLRHEIKLVAAGNRTGGKELVVHQMKTLYAQDYHSTEERKQYRSVVRSTIRVLVHAMIDLIKDTGINLPSQLNQEFAILLHEVDTVDTQSITPDGVQAVERIWSCPEFASLYTQNFEISFPPCAPYFVQEIRRIASTDYIPTEADIGRLIQYTRGVKEARFKWNELDVHLFNMNGYCSENFRKRWYHQLEGATALVYTLDVSEYDRPYLGQSSQSHLVYELGAFASWASLQEFADSSVILIFNNFTRFCDKLAHAPLETFFDDFVPNDTDREGAARNYILRRFKKVNRNGLSIYSFWVDLDLVDNAPLYTSIKNTLQHVQQRKAREVYNSSSQILRSGSRSSTGLAGRLLRSRSGTLSKSTTEIGGSRVISPVRSDMTGVS